MSLSLSLFRAVIAKAFRPELLVALCLLLFWPTVTAAQNLEKEFITEFDKISHLPPQERSLKAIDICNKYLADYPNETALIFYRGTFKELANQQASAIEDYKKVLTLDQNFLEAVERLSNLYNQADDEEQLKYYASKFLTLAPIDVESFKLMGHYHLDYGDLDSAIYYYRKSASLSSSKGTGSYLHLGLALNRDHQFEEAIKVYSDALEVRKNDPDILFEIGFAYYGLNEFEKAKKYISSAIAIKPIARYYRNLYASLYSLGDWKGASEAIDNALSMDSTSIHDITQRQRLIDEGRYVASTVPEKVLPVDDEISDEAHTHRNAAMAFMDNEKYQEATIEFRKAIALGDSSARTHMYFGYALVRLDNLEEAKTHYLAALDKDESSYRWLEYAQLLSWLNDESGRIEAIKRAIALDPEHAISNYFMGQHYGDKGELYEALSYYNKAVRYDPNEPAFYEARGYVWFEINDYHMAVNDFEKVIAMKKLSANEEIQPSVYSYYGLSLAKIKRYREAIEMYTIAIGLYKDDEGLFYNRAISHYNLKNYERAIADFDQCESLGFENTNIYSYRGASYHMLKNYSKANENFKMGLAKGDRNSSAYSWLAYSEEELGNFEEAEKAMRRAIKIKESHFLHSYHARMLSNLEKYNEALIAAEKAINLNSKYYRGYLEKGRALLKLGKTGLAMLSLEQALKLDFNQAETWVLMGSLWSFETADCDGLKNLREKIITSSLD